LNKIGFTISLFFITFFGISETRPIALRALYCSCRSDLATEIEAWEGGRLIKKTSGNSAYSGGGGSAYAKKLITVTPGTTYTVSVGIGSITQTTTAAGFMV
jgi:hypothetical protein